jgi:heme-degrading monooxygenase HmoA
MIARVWRGWTTTENKGAYQKLLGEKVLPGLERIDGYRGGWVLCKEDEKSKDEVEFLVVNFFESLDAVKAFAGPEYRVPVFEPEAKRLLSKAEPVAQHYEVRLTSEGHPQMIAKS